MALSSPNYDPAEALDLLFEDPASLDLLPDLFEYTMKYNTALTEVIHQDQAVYKQQIEQLREEKTAKIDEETENFDEESETVVKNNTNSQVSPANQQDPSNLADIHDELLLLIQEITSMRAIATTTESSITKMTSTIQKLDQCKKNLVLSVTVLKRLQMLLSAYHSLTELVAQKGPKNYSEILNLFSVVLDLNTHFKSYKSVDEINQLSKNIHLLKNSVTTAIFDDFESLLANSDPKRHEEYISAAKILETLGPSYKNKLILWFCNNQLHEIKSIFGNVHDEAASLENIPRRYVFFKRLLKSYEESHRKYFPVQWQVDKQLAFKFCEFNRSSVQQSLDQNLDLNVAGVVQSLTSTLEFENYLTDYFSKKSKFLLSKVPDLKEEEFSNNDFAKSISGSFEPFLRYWLQDKESEMDSKFEEWKAFLTKPATEDQPEDTELTNVFPSSADLFRTYKSILSQLVKLSNGPIMLEIVDFFSKNLSVYLSQILVPLIPTSDAILASSSTQDCFRYLSLVINTCSYVNTTVEQLSVTLVDLAKDDVKEQTQQKIESVLDPAKEEYLVTINECLRVMLRKMELNNEINFREMINGNWRYIDEVSDASRYVVNLVKSLNEDTQLVLSSINNPSYNRVFLDKLIDLIIEKMVVNLVKLKPINSKMPSQILLDLSLLKSFFNKLPFMRSIYTITSPNLESSTNIDQILIPETEPDPKKYNFTISKSYLSRLSNQFLKLEQILKVLMISSSDMSDLINNYFMIIQDYDFENFSKILVLKGVITQIKPIHSNEKRSLLKFREMFDKNLRELQIDPDSAPNNSFIKNFSVDNPVAVGSPLLNTKLSPNGSLKGFNSLITNSPLMNSPLMSGSLQSLSPNLGLFGNNNAASPNLITKENLEKNFKEFAVNSEASVKNLNENFKSNFGKLFNRPQ